MATPFRSEYSDRGFVFQPSLLSPAEMATVNRELDAIIAGETDPQRIIREKDGATRAPSSIRSCGTTFLAGWCGIQYWSAPSRTCSASASMSGRSASTARSPSMATSGSGTRTIRPTARTTSSPTPRMVNALLFIDDVSHLNGPLMLVPGSQKLTSDMPENTDQGTSYSFRYTTREVIEAEVKRAGIEVPTGPAGSVDLHGRQHACTARAPTCRRTPRRLATITYNAMSNKATRRSVRPAHIVPDDKDVRAVEALGADCLASVPA